MSNLYATLGEIKAAVPNLQSEVNLDDVFLRSLEIASRFVERYCRRIFFPVIATKYFDNSGKNEQWVPDLISLTSLAYSDDDGQTYTALASDDYILTVAGDYNSDKSYTKIILDVNGDISIFSVGQRSVRAVGVWGYSDDRNKVFEDSQDTVENNPLSSSGTSITVNDADGLNLLGVEPRFEIGQLLRIESEYLEVTDIDYDANTLTVVRARNGSTAASHVQNTLIEIFRPPLAVKEAVIFLGFEMLTRSFGDLSKLDAVPLKQFRLQSVNAISAEVRALLESYIKMSVG